MLTLILKEERTCWIQAIHSFTSFPISSPADEKNYVEACNPRNKPLYDDHKAPQQPGQYLLLQGPGPPKQAAPVYADCVSVRRTKKAVPTSASPVYYQASGKDLPVYDEPVKMLQVPTGVKNDRNAGEFSQDQLALVFDLLQKIIPGHYGSVPMDNSAQSSPAPVRLDTPPSEIESLYDDIISTPPSEESHIYESFEEDRSTASHEVRVAKPVPPPVPMKRKKIRGSSSRFGGELHSTGHCGLVRPSGEDCTESISKYTSTVTVLVLTLLH